MIPTECRIIQGEKIRSLGSLTLENDRVRATLLPEFGAKLHEFTHQGSGRDFLYHNPRLQPRAPVYGANIDNWWSGGVDEAIPTGHPCVYRGEELPYLGEVWSQAWDCEVTCNTPERVEVHASCSTIIAPLFVERWHSLTAGESVLRTRHRVTNVGYQPVDFLWGIHPAFTIQPGYRIDLPARTVWVAESNPDFHLGRRGSTYQWPYARQADGTIVDMRQVPPPQIGWHELHHAIELDEGWLALTDPDARLGVALSFSTEVFNTVWLWLVYGGWRDLYAAALEAWNGYPAKLTDALSMGRCTRLIPGEYIETTTGLIAYCGLESVKSVSLEGIVSA
jgi:galactose mutarotase-like enzyme